MPTPSDQTTPPPDRRAFLQRALAAGAAAWTAPVVLGSLASPAAATTGDCPARVQVIDSPKAESKNPNSFLTFTVGSAIPVGRTVVVTVATAPSRAAQACTDSGGNLYSLDAIRTGGAADVYIFSAHVLNALGVGATITPTWSGFSGSASAAAFEFCGIAESNRVVSSNSNSGNTTTPSSGTATTTGTGVLVGVVNHGVNNDATYTNLSLANLEADVPEASGQRVMHPTWQIATGSYAASGTIASGNQWAAAIVAYATV